MDFLMRLLAAFERQIEFSYTESAIKKQFTVSQAGQTGVQCWGDGGERERRKCGGGRGSIIKPLL